MLRFAIAALTTIALTMPASAVLKKTGKCYKFDQSGKKIYYPCSRNPSMQDEIAAQERIKANQPSKPTTQQCHMVNGNLVCR